MIEQVPSRLTRLTRTVRERSFPIARAYESRALARRLRGSVGEAFVYQMGKVGSTSVVAALRRAAPDLLVHHVHRVSDATLPAFEAFTRSTFRRRLVSGGARRSLVQQIVAARHLRRELAEPTDGRRLKVITLVREPVGRNVSDCFEVLKLLLDYDLAARLDRRSVEEVCDEVCQLFLTTYPNHDLPLTFFDTEIRATLGIDVYGRPFSFDEGCQVHRTDRVDLLVVRAEDLDGAGGERIRAFLGLPSLELRCANAGENKEYADVYRLGKARIVLPDAYLERMYTSKYATHFYSAAELERLRGRWARRAVATLDS